MNPVEKRAFVTGASGFVGAHLVYSLLKKGYRVSALVRSTKNLSAFHALATFYPDVSTHEIDWVEGDLLIPEVWADNLAWADVVFHAAALVSFSPRDKHRLMETNVTGTAHVVNTSLKHNKTLLYVSSVAALGRSEKNASVTEQTLWKNSDHNTDYAISKYLAEQEVWRGVEEGLTAAIVCPGIILGPWAKKTGSGQIPALVKKQMPFYPVGENGFVGVRDVVSMLIALYEQRCFGQRFLCVAENTSYRSVLTQFAACMMVSPPKTPLQGPLLHVLIIASRLAEKLILPFPFPSQGLKSTSLKTQYFSVHKDQIASFSYIPLEETIREAANEYNKRVY